MTCTGCATGLANGTMVSIRMKVGEEDIVFRRCSKCEVNIWEDIDGEIGLDRVLDLARPAR